MSEELMHQVTIAALVTNHYLGNTEKNILTKITTYNIKWQITFLIQQATNTNSVVGHTDRIKSGEVLGMSNIEAALFMSKGIYAIICETNITVETVHSNSQYQYSANTQRAME